MKKYMNMINLVLMMIILYTGISTMDVVKQMKQPIELNRTAIAEEVKVNSEKNKEKVEDDKLLLANKELEVKKAKLQPVVLGYNTKVKLGMIKPIEEVKDNTMANARQIQQPMSRGNSQQSTNIQVAEGAGNSSSMTHNGIRYVKSNIQITFYTNTAAETDSSPNIVASNKQIRPGMVAMNGVPFGTRVHIPSFGKHIAGLGGINNFVVEDRMAPHEASKATHRVDFYVPRLQGESDYQYLKRVNSYGRYTVTGYIGYKA